MDRRQFSKNLGLILAGTSIPLSGFASTVKKKLGYVIDNTVDPEFCSIWLNNKFMTVREISKFEITNIEKYMSVIFNSIDDDFDFDKYIRLIQGSMLLGDDDLTLKLVGKFSTQSKKEQNLHPGSSVHHFNMSRVSDLFFIFKDYDSFLNIENSLDSNSRVVNKLKKGLIEEANSIFYQSYKDKEFANHSIMVRLTYS